MQYYAHYEEKTGKILGFYADDIHGSKMPEPKIPISEAEWQDVLSNQNSRKVSLETLKIVETVPPAATRDECLAAVRLRRNQLLSETDWTQLVDAVMPEQQQTSWKVYRQALRDFPATCNPYSPDWPERPTL